MWLSGVPEEDDVSLVSSSSSAAGTQPSSPTPPSSGSSALPPEPPLQQQQPTHSSLQQQLEHSHSALQQQHQHPAWARSAPPVRSSSERNERTSERSGGAAAAASAAATAASASASASSFPAFSPTAAAAASSLQRSPSGSSLHLHPSNPTRSPLSSPTSQTRGGTPSALSQSVSRVFPPNNHNHSYAPPPASSAAASSHWPSFAFERQYPAQPQSIPWARFSEEEPSAIEHAIVPPARNRIPEHSDSVPSWQRFSEAEPQSFSVLEEDSSHTSSANSADHTMVGHEQHPWQSFSVAAVGGGDDHAIVAPSRNRTIHQDTAESKEGDPSSAAGETYCAVCMSEGCDAFLLPCNHNFHAACILQWVESDHQVPQHRLSCPLCRQSIEQFVPLESTGIEDRSGDMLERFLKVWEKHYMSRGPAPGGAGAANGGAGGGADDGEQLIKPGSTQEIDEAQKQQVQLQSQDSTLVSTPDGSSLLSTPATAEQNAWQQLYQDVFFIPDSLPDDFIIPHAAATGAATTEQLSIEEEQRRASMFRQDAHHASAVGDNHAANIAAVDGGLTSGAGGSGSALSGSLGFLTSTPFALLNSLLSAFQPSISGGSGTMTPLRSPIAARRPVRPVQRILFPEPEAADESEVTESVDNLRILEPDSSTISSASGSASASVSSSSELESAPPPLSGSPTPSAVIPVFAGSVAGAATAASQSLTSGRGAGALAPSPAYASIPAIAAYFTSYEMMKQELALSPSLSSAATTGVDPRAALLNAENTGKYFLAASASGAISNVVKMTLSPGVISLAGAFASTAQISARMGIQFSVFEQTKNAFALYRHRRAGEDLNAAEVLMGATLGGIVAASVMYPIQHLIPVQQWAMTAPTPPIVPASSVPPAGFGPIGGGGGGAAGGGPGVAGALAKPTLLACLGRFLPACVATAVTYEYAYRFFRDRNRQNTPLPSPTHAALDSAASSSSSSSSSPPATALSSPVSGSASAGGWLHGIASRTSSLLRVMGLDVGVEEARELIPVRHNSNAASVAAAGAAVMTDSAAIAAASSMQLPPRVPTGSWPARSSSHSTSHSHPHSSSSSPYVPLVRTLGHAVPITHHFPAGMTPAASASVSASVAASSGAAQHVVPHVHVAPTRGHSTPSSSIPASASVHNSSGSQRRPGPIAASSSFTLQVPSNATSSTLSRSASHPLLTMFHTRTNSHSSAAHNSLLEPW